MSNQFRGRGSDRGGGYRGGRGGPGPGGRGGQGSDGGGGYRGGRGGPGPGSAGPGGRGGQGPRGGSDRGRGGFQPRGGGPPTGKIQPGAFSEKALALVTNSYEIKVKKPAVAMHQIDVAMTIGKSKEEIPIRERRVEIMKELELQEKFAIDGYDGQKIGFSSNPKKICKKYSLVHNKKDVTVTLTSCGEVENISQAFDAGVDRGFNMTPAVSCINVILQWQELKTLKDWIKVARDKFLFDAPQGHELFQSVSLSREVCYPCDARLLYGSCPKLCRGPAKTFLTLDLTAMPVLDPAPVKAYFQANSRDLASLLRGVKLDVRYGQTDPKSGKELHFKKTFEAIDNRKPSQHKFQDANGKQVSVAQYFKSTYNLTCDESLPLIKMKSSSPNAVYIPMEFCHVMPGQKYPDPQDKLKAQVIRKLALPPEKRFEHIQKFRSLIAPALFKVMSSLGYDPNTAMMGNSPIETQGQVLKKPTVMFNSQSQASERTKGDSMPNNARFNKPPVITSVYILDCQTKENINPDRFYIDFCQAGSAYGVDLPRGLTNVVRIDPRDKNACLSRPGQVLPKAFDDFFQQVVAAEKDSLPSTLVIGLVSKMSRFVVTDAYSFIKTAGDRTYFVISQCFNTDKVNRDSRIFDRPYLQNIWKKICNKFATGYSHGIFSKNKVFGISQVPPSANDEPVIIFGADVTHYTTSSEASIPSVAAVCASMDPQFMKYRTFMYPSRQKEEAIDRLKEIVKHALMLFYQKNKVQPTKIIFYRDGVSESQFESTLMRECKAIEVACHELSPEYSPHIIFIVVQKRIADKLMPKALYEGEGNNSNVPMGTIVDSDITLASEFPSALLVSHFGAMGTSKPIKIAVLFNGGANVPDNQKPGLHELLALTYYLCHCSPRCTKVIRLPAPVLHAHLAAERGRVYINHLTAAARMGKKVDVELIYSLSEVLNEVAKKANLNFHI